MLLHNFGILECLVTWEYVSHTLLLYGKRTPCTCPKVDGGVRRCEQELRCRMNSEETINLTDDPVVTREFSISFAFASTVRCLPVSLSFSLLSFLLERPASNKLFGVYTYYTIQTT
jgi:hypothetical protein